MGHLLVHAGLQRVVAGGAIAKNGGDRTITRKAVGVYQRLPRAQTRHDVLWHAIRETAPHRSHVPDRDNRARANLALHGKVVVRGPRIPRIGGPDSDASR